MILAATITLALLSPQPAEPTWSERFHRLPEHWQVWAKRTSACESDYPSQHDGSGSHHGAFQFLLSTWRMAGGKGDPHTQTWPHQAVIAVRWAKRAGTGQWACSP